MTEVVDSHSRIADAPIAAVTYGGDLCSVAHDFILAARYYEVPMVGDYSRLRSLGSHG